MEWPTKSVGHRSNHLTDTEADMTSRRDFLKGLAVGSVAVGGWSAATRLAKPSSDGTVLWGFNAPVLDQGNVGSCTGNAVTQFLNTDFAIGRSKRKSYLTEDDAVKIYTAATVYDDPVFPGNYPTVDTGSNGDFACVGAVQLGYLSGFGNICPDLASIVAALGKQPLIVGSQWTYSMFSPDYRGFVEATGDLVGGHEYLMLGYDAPGRYFTFLNSWSEKWGLKGRFKVKADDYVKLLDGEPTAVVAPDVKCCTAS